jgi:hypothetical protein
LWVAVGSAYTVVGAVLLITQIDDINQRFDS